MKKTVTPATQEAPIENTAPNPGQEHAMVTGQENAVDNYQEPTSGIQGEWGQDDVILPTISLVQKSGDMSENWTQGTWVFDKNLAITTSYDNAEKPAEDAVPRFPATVVGLKKYWRENKEFKDPGFARRWDTVEEALATPVTDPLGNPVPPGPDGQPVFYKRANKGKGTFAEAADVILLFPVPDEYSEFNFEGQGYARAIYRAASTAWQAAKTLYSGALGAARRNAKKGEPITVKEYVVNWQFGARKETGGSGDVYFKPIVANQGRHPDAFIQWVEDEVLAGV